MANRLPTSAVPFLPIARGTLSGLAMLLDQDTRPLILSHLCYMDIWSLRSTNNTLRTITIGEVFTTGPHQGRNNVSRLASAPCETDGPNCTRTGNVMYCESAWNSRWLTLQRPPLHRLCAECREDTEDDCNDLPVVQIGDLPPLGQEDEQINKHLWVPLCTECAFEEEVINAELGHQGPGIGPLPANPGPLRYWQTRFGIRTLCNCARKYVKQPYYCTPDRELALNRFLQLAETVGEQRRRRNAVTGRWEACGDRMKKKLCLCGNVFSTQPLLRPIRFCLICKELDFPPLGGNQQAMYSARVKERVERERLELGARWSREILIPTVKVPAEPRKRKRK